MSAVFRYDKTKVNSIIWLVGEVVKPQSRFSGRNRQGGGFSAPLKCLAFLWAAPPPFFARMCSRGAMGCLASGMLSGSVSRRSLKHLHCEQHFENDLK
jgi:hypothetical protein